MWWCKNQFWCEYVEHRSKNVSIYMQSGFCLQFSSPLSLVRKCIVWIITKEDEQLVRKRSKYDTIDDHNMLVWSESIVIHLIPQQDMDDIKCQEWPLWLYSSLFVHCCDKTLKMQMRYTEGERETWGWTCLISMTYY